MYFTIEVITKSNHTVAHVSILVCMCRSYVAVRHLCTWGSRQNKAHHIVKTKQSRSYCSSCAHVLHRSRHPPFLVHIVAHSAPPFAAGTRRCQRVTRLGLCGGIYIHTWMETGSAILAFGEDRSSAKFFSYESACKVR